MNITIDQRSLNHLHRLWRSRAKTLLQAAALLPDGPITDKIRQVADAYGQCSEELESPPTKIFDALGYNEPEYVLPTELARTFRSPTAADGENEKVQPRKAGEKTEPEELTDK